MKICAYLLHFIHLGHSYLSNVFARLVQQRTDTNLCGQDGVRCYTYNVPVICILHANVCTMKGQLQYLLKEKSIQFGLHDLRVGGMMVTARSQLKWRTG